MTTKAKFIKSYSNHVGRMFYRFVVSNGTHERTYDICVREQRGGLMTMGRPEAKAEAIRRFNQDFPGE